MTSFIQGNLHHSRAATAVLLKRMDELQSSCALLQEPWIGPGGELRGLSSFRGHIFSCSSIRKPRAVILSRKPAFLLQDFVSRDLVAVKMSLPNVGTVILASAYFANEDNANVPNEETKRLITYCSSNKLPIVLSCDANAHHVLYGSTDTNQRGSALLEFLLQENLYVVNLGSVPTFITAVREEVLDLTICSSDVVSKVTDWKVSLEETLSDHRHILFKVGDKEEEKEVCIKDPKKTNWLLFKENLENLTLSCPRHQPANRQELELRAADISSKILQAQEDACPEKRVATGVTPRWWDKEIETKRRETRRLYNKKKRTGQQTDIDSFKVARNQYMKAIDMARGNSFKRFVSEIDSLPQASRCQKALSKAPSVAMGPISTATGAHTENDYDALKALMEAHFPGYVITGNEDPIIECQQNLVTGLPADECGLLEEMVSENRIRAAIFKFLPYKSPGPDRIVPAMLQQGAEVIIPVLAPLIKASIQMGHIPSVWRKVKVIFIPKIGRSDFTDASSFRPITLSSFILKVIERLIEWNIREYIETRCPLHPAQHAYQKGKSTETALHSLVTRLEKCIGHKDVAFVSFLDISGAFNNVSFQAIIQALEERNIDSFIICWIRNMLSSRLVLSSRGEANIAVSVNRGCPQGGVLSPLLWSLVVDDLLKKLEKLGIFAQAYADDVAIPVVGKIPSVLSDITSSTLNFVMKWCQDKGLTVNPSKTDVLIVTNRKKLGRFPDVKIEGRALEIKDSVKYLGVIIDKRLNWQLHINKVIDKARAVFYTMRRMFSTTWGLSTKMVRWMYMSMVRPIIAYGAIVWEHRTKVKSVQQMLQKFQRLICVGATGAFRSTPTAALEVLLDIPPLHMFISQQAQMANFRLNGTNAKLKSCLTSNPCFMMPQDKIITVNDPDGCFLRRIPNRDDWENGLASCFPKDSTVIYTDGSLMNGKAGAGVYCEEPLLRISLPMGSYVTVFQAEIFAIRVALDACRKLPKKRVYVCSDSQAAILALSNPTIKSNLVSDCRKTLKTLKTEDNKYVELVWVPGHKGVKGNEEADQLAREGSEILPIGPEPFLPVGPASVKTAFKDQVYCDFKHYWATIPGLVHSKATLPNPNPKFGLHLINAKRTVGKAVVALLTGHGPFKEHLDKMGFAVGSISCRKCGEAYETAMHILCECPIFWQERGEHLGGHVLSLNEIVKVPLSNVSKYVKAINFTDYFVYSIA